MTLYLGELNAIMSFPPRFDEWIQHGRSITSNITSIEADGCCYCRESKNE
jgi:hypothetical protein